MKTFEEKYTAWIDGELKGEEFAQFERELKTRADADADKAATLQLRKLLKENYGAPSLTNADFFNHQILRQIEVEQSQPSTRARSFFWTLPRLAFAGAASLAIGLTLFFLIIPRGAPPAEQSGYLAQVL